MINTTTSDIIEWSREINKKFKANSSLMDTLKSDCESQLETEKKWIDEFLSSGIHNLTQITSVSSYLLLKDTNVQNLENTFGKRKQNASIHELAVLAFGINQLRFRIPNFPYTLAAIENKKDYSIYQLKTTLGLSSSYSDFIKTATYSQFLPVFIQLVFAIKHGKSALGFTHYNLSPASISIKKLDTPHYITYDDDVIVLSSLIPIINSFESSHIYATNSEGRKVSLGCTDSKMVKFGILRDRVFPMTDIYKLVIETYKGCGDEHIKSIISEIFKYFNSKEAICDVVLSQSVLKYALPPTPMTRGYNLEDFVSYLSDLADDGVFSKTVFSSEGYSKTSPIPFYKPYHDIVGSEKLEFSGAFDTHRHLTSFVNSISGTSSSSVANAKAVLKTFTSSYIKGFTSDVSLFQDSLKTLTQSFDAVKVLVERNNSKIYNAVSKDENASIELIDDSLSAFEKFVYNVKCFKYLITLYWTKTSETPRPVLTKLSLFEKGVTTISQKFSFILSKIGEIAGHDSCVSNELGKRITDGLLFLK